MFTGKQSKLFREDIRERKRLGEVKEVKRSGTAFWGSALMHDCFWLQPCNNTKVHCSRLWNRRYMPHLVLLLLNYCTREQVCASLHVSYVWYTVYSVSNSFNPSNCVVSVFSQLHLDFHISSFTNDMSYKQGAHLIAVKLLDVFINFYNYFKLSAT